MTSKTKALRSDPDLTPCYNSLWDECCPSRCPIPTAAERLLVHEGWKECAQVVLACDRSRPSLHLAGLHIPRCGDRKRGIGRSVLVHLTNTADTLGVVLTLDVDEDPDPDHCEEQMTPVDLKAWYTRYGFVKVGLRDGRYWQMERLPRSSLVNAENA